MSLITYRKPQRLVAEKEQKDEPTPISIVGGGRDSALIAFTQAQEAGR